ncbi:TRAP transporter small permease [Anaerospora hongkongensis]|uniref:TRAP transporter small permease n=1 Tax=Anaerospora hongkongensis TaxID=244830 RepID=UPI0028A08FE8|nr:TRAP transporter small permease [Anaerospora hongkongensis]
MRILVKFADKAITFLMAGFLLLMGIFVLGNVILRYFFNSGLPWAEELSRFLFVWITFLGAIEAMKENKHLGFSSLIKKMKPRIQKLFYVISNIVMLYILYLLLTGSWAMTVLGMNNRASTTDVPLAFMFGVGLITFSCMIVIVFVNTYKALFVEGAVSTLIELQESEEEVQLTALSKGDDMR